MEAAKDPAVELAEVARELRRHVRWAQSIGEIEAPLPDVRPASANAPAPPAPHAVALAPPAPDGRPAHGGAPRSFAPAPAGRPAKETAPPTPGAPPAHEVAPRFDGVPTLEQVRAVLGDCRRCGLCATRTKLVFGVGNPAAELVFVGEGPGADEDRAGEPFVGKAGQLLTRMIEAMGFRRDQVYICNVVKCRPPGNRNPLPDEIAACEPFLRGQLAAIRPQAIVALGKFAAQTLLRTDTPITRLRGTWQSYEGIPLMPTFHPAYLLRSPHEKAKAWSDLKQVLARLGRQPPAR